MSDAFANPCRPKDDPTGLIFLVALEAALVISWSGSFIGIRFAIDQAPIFLILLWRSLMSGLILLPFAVKFGPIPSRKDLLAQILYGALAMASYLGALALAMSYEVPTALAALVADMLPLMVALLSWPLLGQALTARQWVGSAIGLTGVLVASGRSLSLGNVPVWAYGLPALGTLSLAAATLVQKRRPTSMPVHQVLCVQSLSAGVVFAPFAWHEGGVLPVLEPGFVGGVLWLVFVATLGAWGLYYLALRNSSPARVTTVLYLSPPVVMVWAWIMFGEPLSFSMAAGLVVSLLGVIVARSQRPSGRRQTLASGSRTPAYPRPRGEGGGDGEAVG